METISARRVLAAFLTVAAVFAAGTIGFHASSDEGWLDSFYRTVVTSSLTGMDSPPHGRMGRILSIALILFGVAIFAYVAALVVETIAAGLLGGAWREKRRLKEIEALTNHTIVCGYGRVGRRIAEEFLHADAPFVVLDNNPDVIALAAERDVNYVEGDGTEDEDLQRAGLDRARALVAASDSDAANLYIVLSARAARPELLIVARASEEEAEKKLRLAGADRVVLPYATAGRVMANLVIKPQVAEFVSTVTMAGGPDLRFEQIQVPHDWAESGKQLHDLHVRSRTGAVVIAVQKPGGEFITRPDGHTLVESGDIVVGVGSADEIVALEPMLAAREALAHQER
jgi:voltage-gated potassium channel